MSERSAARRFAPVFLVFGGVWLLIRYLFPLFSPFLLGLALALAAEPFVNFLVRRLRLRRGCAAFGAVTAVLLVLSGCTVLLVRFVLQRAASLTRAMGSLAGQIGQVEETLAQLASRAPAGLAQPLEKAARDLFQTDGSLITEGTKAAISAAGKAAEGLPGLLMLLGTAVLAGYMISAQLPSLRGKAAASPLWKNHLSPALLRLRSCSLCWLKAQLRLSSVTFCIVLAGFFLLGVKQMVPLALLTAVVDAVPLLGTGTVLLPWVLTCLLTGDVVRAVGLLGVYLTAMLTRSTLEPRLVGQHLGLNPLASLIALYMGYRLWGFAGMIAAPILTVTARELTRDG